MSTFSTSLVREEISASTRAQFSSYDWCTRLLNDTSLIPVQTVHQHTSTDVDSKFMSSTLRDHDALLGVQSFYKLRQPPAQTSGSAASAPYVLDPLPPGELQTLYILGNGASGHAGISHGGLVATLLDQQTGSLMIADSATPRPYTVYCNVHYLRPVSLPSAVQVCAWKSKIQGRKHWVMAEIRDGKGAVLASAESLYVNVQSKL
ncbi:MAG: hypothetical protein Q9157_001159 [Trypethelium eluteriae]